MITKIKGRRVHFKCTMIDVPCLENKHWCGGGREGAHGYPDTSAAGHVDKANGSLLYRNIYI